VPTDDRPRWDEQRARELTGKTVLLGLTFTDADGEVLDQAQRHGVIEGAEPEAGIGIRLVAPGQPWDGELYRLPPDLRPFVAAAPGAYTLRSTGETVVDPDFTSSWEIRAPASEDDTPETRKARLEESRRFGFLPD
jgi:hypothetical protein